MEQNFPQLQELYEKYCDMIYRICFLYMRNPDDAWDMVQDVFLKLIQSKPVFSDEKKEKAWLIVTASNLCKNHLKHWWRKKTVGISGTILRSRTRRRKRCNRSYNETARESAPACLSALL